MVEYFVDSNYPQIPSYPGPNSRSAGTGPAAAPLATRAARLPHKQNSGAKPGPPPAAYRLDSHAAGCSTGPPARNRLGPAAEGGDRIRPDPRGSPAPGRPRARRAVDRRPRCDRSWEDAEARSRAAAAVARCGVLGESNCGSSDGRPSTAAAAGLPHGIGMQLQKFYRLCTRWQRETAGQGYVGGRARATGGGRVAGGRGVARRQARRRPPGRARWTSSGTPGRRWPTAQMTSQAQLRAAGPRARCRLSMSRWVRPAPRAPRALSTMQPRWWCIPEAAALRVQLLPTFLVHVPRRKAGRCARL